MKRWSMLFVLAGATTARACVWDSDTLFQESRDKPGVLDAIVGRVARYPAVYYERRLEIAKERLAKNPADLASYDNAGVACDRLGRLDEAIAWMKKKRLHLASGTKDDRYRTESNEGTFWAHKWFAGGMDRSNLAWIENGQTMLAKAIQVNPEAHFGREKVQLKFYEWVLSNRSERLASSLFEGKATAEDRKKALDGLVGLVMLGSAWDNIDILGAIPELVKTDRAIGHFAKIRVEELQKAGRKSVLGDQFQFRLYGDTIHADNVVLNYRLLSESARNYRQNLDTFVTSQVRKGLHPDLDRQAFWSGYVELPRPELVDVSLLTRINRRPGAWPLIIFAGSAVLLIGLVIVRDVRRRRRALSNPQ